MRLYALLLRLYPASFRAEYGTELRAVFAQRRRDTTGLAGTVALWLDALTDTIVSAARIHWDILRQDLNYARRTLSRTPGFTITATLVAALGIGATTAAFTITDHVLIRPLPFPDADRLVKLWQDQSFRGYSRMELSPGNYLDWKAQSKSFEGMAAYVARAMNLVGHGRPVRLEGAVTTPDLFDVLGARALIGRTFSPVDAEYATTDPIVLSYGTWQTLFGADSGVLGRKIVLDEEPREIIGVMPAGFHFPTRDARFWTPIRFQPQELEDRADVFLRAVARLRRGVTIEQARAELGGIAAELERAFPRANAHTGATVVRLRDEVSPQSRFQLQVLAAASAGVLLIAVVNLANLLIARALTRRHELAVRMALGAAPERLVRQMLTESLVLAGLGGIAGLLLATSVIPLVVRLVPNALPVAEAPALDLRVLVVTAVITIATGIGFGVLPARRARKDAASSGLHEGSRAGISRPTERLRSALVVAEVAACVVLLVASGLLMRALWRVQRTDPGFRPDNVLTLRTALPMPKYEATATRVQFYRQVLDDLRTLPGVSQAAYISFLPMVMRGGIWPVRLEGQPENATESAMASVRFATPGFFDVLSIPIREGRDVAESDTSTSEFVAIVSASFARQHWPGQSALGRRFFVAFQDRTVVGVVGDVRVRGLERESDPQVYLPYQQVPDGGLIFYAPKDLVIKAAAPATLTTAIQEIVARADPHQPVSDIRLLADIVEADTATREVQVRALGGFSASAFVLAALGIHGLLLFMVTTRFREIGVRIALGASARNIYTLIFGRALALSAIGVAVGVLAAYAVGRGIEAQLAGIDAADPKTFGGALALVLVMTIAGSVLPAVRATRIDPIKAIRSE